MLRVILVSGYKRSGKDYVAEKLNERIEDSQVLAFAEPIKEILATTLGISKSTFDKYKNNSELLFTLDGTLVTDCRSMIQQFGNEAMKSQFGNEVWTNLLISKLPVDGVVIVSDWRFIVEYEGIVAKADEVITIRVIDDNLTAGTHASEHELDNFPFMYQLNNTPKSNDILESIDLLVKEF